MKFTPKSSIKKFLALLTVLTGIITIASGYTFIKFIRPRVIRLSQLFAENEVAKIIDDEIKNLMLKEFLSYDKITTITRDSSGRVTSVSTNSVLINNFANDLDIAIGDQIDNRELIENQVYLTSFLGIDILSGMGPKVTVRFQPVSVTNADVHHTFEEAGINQTIHTIHLCISVEIEILMPFAYSTIEVSSDMPIAQTLIVGTVPDAYLNRQK